MAAKVGRRAQIQEEWRPRLRTEVRQFKLLLPKHHGLCSGRRRNVSTWELG